ncbi:hypothetical protein [Streptomyces europaeiscabiei]|uniref:hypothetical protein n=1 Tax=Streptomyces europaeiscabiei TaxID=146819 RepID=UPI0029BCF665|nr:hypothetical protein [Streptomyces europaeiscabiei]MDX3586013.1 hypothetical protein [Streptomyces europaeiscabiei]MDX3635513.1 hypothetical protein [Streptomyces europaeiscabiei]MDX3653744.1 hypothetical protein [Streptomyces europaeiscabiei]WUD35064.1 hypothetical protein OG858_29045 [Streptomyces europaeiscabiei]
MTGSGSADGLGRDGGDGDHRGRHGSGRSGTYSGTYDDREGREMPSGRAEPDRDEGRDSERRDSAGPDDGRRFLSDGTAVDRVSEALAPEASAPEASAPEALAPEAPAPEASVPDGAASSVDSLLAAAVRGGASADSAGEARAVAAFRAARETGPRTARTRRRDDWRPNARRRVQLSIRTTLAVLLASLTLGGVAFAAIGSATRDDEGAGGDRGGYGGQDRRPRPTDGAPARPGPSTAPRTTPSTADRPDRDEESGASQQPDEDRQAEGNGDGAKGDGRHGSDRTGEDTGDRRGESPRPAEPNASASSRSRVPNEPSRPTGAGGRSPGDADRNRGGAAGNPGSAERKPGSAERDPGDGAKVPETK